MERIRVRICTGTACFVQGASHMQHIDETLPPDVVPHVSIELARCLGYCHTGTESKPPYATVKGKIIDGVTVDSLIDSIRREISNT